MRGLLSPNGKVRTPISNRATVSQGAAGWGAWGVVEVVMRREREGQAPFYEAQRTLGRTAGTLK